MDRQLVTWSMAALLALGLMGPGSARGYDQSHHGWSGHDSGPKVEVVVKVDDDRAMYQHWYRAQTARCHDDIDEITGERLADLLQLVTDVNRDRVELQNHDGDKQTIYLNERTHYHFEPLKTSTCDFSHRGSDYTGVHPGDMIIVQGFLRAGGFAASSVRVVDHAWGWGAEAATAATYDGFRAYGEIRDVDYVHDRFEVTANVGRRLVGLAADGVVLLNGHEVAVGTLHHGDRVVIYYTKEATSSYTPRIEVSRVVVLRGNEAYPDGDRPYLCDPRYHADEHPADAGAVLEGRVEGVSGGLFFNRITLRDGGHSVSVLVGKALTAEGHHGDRLPVTELHPGDVVHIAYTELDGTYFAAHVELR